jgi:MATE family multidrug resistance protein
MGVAFLAAQSVLVTVTGTTFQIPFPLSIAGSTRMANLIGAKLVDAAKTSAKVVSFAGR